MLSSEDFVQLKIFPHKSNPRKMINAVVYSRASTVKLVQIPHPKFKDNGLFSSNESFPLGLMSGVTTMMMTVLDRFINMFRPASQGQRNRQWLIIKVHSAGVNPVDAKFLYGDKLPHFLMNIFRFFIEKRVCGIDFSGEVSDAPSDCEYRVGDEVFGTMAYPASGSFAEYAKASTDMIALKPRNLSHSEASVLPLVGLTVVQAFEDNNLREGMHILIFGGSGGTGHIALQVAKLKGAKVTAVCSSRNTQFVKQLGADKVIPYDKTENILVDLADAVRTMGSFNMVFDTVSSVDACDALCRYEQKIRNSSHPLMVEGAEGKYIRLGGSPADWLKAHIKRFLRFNLFPSNRELFWVRFCNSSAQLETLCDYCEQGKLMPIISKHLPFTQLGVHEAFIHQLNRRTVGKMVIDVIPDFEEGVLTGEEEKVEPNEASLKQRLGPTKRA